MSRQELTERLIARGVLKTPVIIEAFQKVDRADFMPESLREQAYIDTAFPIGYGQTISQPYTVAFMFELLQPEPGQKILDIGSGSGWTTALLAHIVGQKDGGRVIGMEVISELRQTGEENVAKYNYIKKGIAEIRCQNAQHGLLEEAPFNQIIAAAALQLGIPQSWKDQLNIGGRIVAPVHWNMVLLTKKSKTDFDEQQFPGFAFVPFVSK